MMPAIYDNANQIMQTPDSVVIRYEMLHETRVIRLDGRPHVSKAIRGYLGDARGHWEGNTLVAGLHECLRSRASCGAIIRPPQRRGIHEGGRMQDALRHRQSTLTPVAACCMAVLVAACVLIGMGAVLISSSGVSSSWNPLPLNPLTATRP